MNIQTVECQPMSDVCCNDDSRGRSSAESQVGVNELEMVARRKKLRFVLREVREAGQVRHNHVQLTFQLIQGGRNNVLCYPYGVINNNKKNTRHRLIGQSY